MGIVYLLMASGCYAALNSIIKLLSHDLPPFELLFYRNLFSTITLLPLIFFYLEDFKVLVQKKSIMVNSIRGSLGFIGIGLWFIAMQSAPLTECIALSFTTPLFITVMAVLVFGEKMSLAKWIALVIGFSGAIVIISPNLHTFELTSIIVLIAAFFWASSAIVVKSFVNHSHPIAIVFFTSCINLILIAPMGFNLSSGITLRELGLMAIGAIMSNMAQIFMALSYKKTPISVVIPFDFMRLVFAIPLAFLLFDEVITTSTLIGAIIIVINSSFLCMLYRKTPKTNCVIVD
jgi:drug/metabolite transporter (DMT)-like permease